MTAYIIVGTTNVRQHEHGKRAPSHLWIKDANFPDAYAPACGMQSFVHARDLHVRLPGEAPLCHRCEALQSVMPPERIKAALEDEKRVLAHMRPNLRWGYLDEPKNNGNVRRFAGKRAVLRAHVLWVPNLSIMEGFTLCTEHREHDHRYPRAFTLAPTAQRIKAPCKWCDRRITSTNRNIDAYLIGEMLK